MYALGIDHLRVKVQVVRDLNLTTRLINGSGATCR